MASINVIKAVMPSLSVVGSTPYFKGENISSFLEAWDDFADDYECTSNSKRKKILRYIDLLYRDKVRAMPEYTTKEDQVFYKALKKEYRDTDHKHLKYSRQFL
jgi:hypothetical protein